MFWKKKEHVCLMSSEYTTIRREIVDLHAELTKLNTRLTELEITNSSVLSKVAYKIRSLKEEKEENKPKDINTNESMRFL